MRDELPRVYNKRHFWERLTREMRSAARHHSDVSLLILDLDHFKRINDAFGHLAGDRVLHATADAVSASLRTEDVVARYGGEELVVLLRGTRLSGARQTAERLRRVVEALDITSDDGVPIPVTISIGVASMATSRAVVPDQLIAAADLSLYLDKRAGRNRIGD